MSVPIPQPTIHWLDCLGPEPSDPHLRNWLQQKGSTTALLNQVYAAQSQSINVTQAQWGKLIDDEANQLNPSRRYWIREVVLYINGKAWMWARSCFPEQTLQAFDINLSSFKQSLGYLLFADPSLKRSDFHYAAITKGHLLFEAAQQHTTTDDNYLWGRRSQLHFRHQPLLLTEVFLPGTLPKLGNGIDD